MKNDIVIQAENVSRIYESGGVKVQALKNINLEIKRGEFLIITGRNGSGKSTLLHQLALLDVPNSGEILIDNQKTTHLSEQKRMEFRLNELGYIFQEYALIAELTAIENVMLPSMMKSNNKISRQKAAEILARVGLEDKMNRLPSQLSGGEQQRVAIARSLINHPKIIFADEPTANLDTVASRDILEIFKTLNETEKITIIMITHEPEELTYASRTIKLVDGVLV